MYFGFCVLQRLSTLVAVNSIRRFDNNDYLTLPSITSGFLITDLRTSHAAFHQSAFASQGNCNNGPQLDLSGLNSGIIFVMKESNRNT